MLKYVIAAGALGALIALPSTAAAQEQSATEATVKVWKTDFSGRPPFKRVLKEVSLAEAAALEAEPGLIETVKKRVVNFSGKPPFRRKVQEVEVIEAASLEIESASEPKFKSPLRTNKARLKRHP